MKNIRRYKKALIRSSKVLLPAILIIFLLLGSTGCSSKKTTKTNTITVWGFDEPDVFKPIIRDFQKQFKSVQANYVKKSLDDDYELDSLNAIAAGKGPDVWTIPNDWMHRHSDKVVPYTPVKAGKDALSKVDPTKYFLPVVLNNVTIKGKIYGLTPSVDTLRIYYNPGLLGTARDEFEKATKGDQTYRKQVTSILDRGPLFWEDIIELNKAFAIKDGENLTRPFIALGTDNNVTNAKDILYLLMLQNKTKIFSDDGQTAVFNLPSQKATGESVVAAAKAIDFYTSFSNTADDNYSWNVNQPNDDDAFTNGKVIAVVGYGTYAEELAQRFPTFKIRQWPMPQILSSSNQEVTDFARFNLLTVPTSSRMQTSAWNFVKYTSSLGQTSYTSTTKRAGSAMNKAPKKLISDRQGGVNPNTVEKFTAQTLPQKTRFPKKFDKLFLEAISNVVTEQLTSQQALDTLADKITQLLRNTGY